MFTELTLTHVCDQIIVWSAGGYFDRKGRAITHYPKRAANGWESRSPASKRAGRWCAASAGPGTQTAVNGPAPHHHDPAEPH